MLGNELLTDRYRYKWLILRYIENYKNHFCTLFNLSNILEISSYKVERYLEEINDDLKLIGSDSSVELTLKSEIVSTRIDHLLLKKMRIKYLYDCEMFTMLHNFFVSELPIKKQLDHLHISQSASYLLHRELKDILSEEKLKLKNNQVLGNELDVRSIFFSTYYELFNGIKNPFPEKIRKMSLAILNQLTEQFLLNIPKTKELKLLLFLDVWLIRISNGHYMDKSYVTYERLDFTHWLKKMLITLYDLPEEVAEHEMAYLAMFFHFEIDKVTFIDDYAVSEAYEQATALTKEFCRLFSEWFHYELTQPTILMELTDINVKWLIYHFREQSFIVKEKFNYFQEINPRLDQFIKAFIQKIEKKQIFQSDAERNKLYYDYLFLLVTKVPIENIEEPIYICIDFSHGNNYNQYIRIMLSSLQSMNIYYQEKIDAATNLFLSDCAMENLSCEQLIWKKPPTSDDWKDLGELLVIIKEQNSEG